jgi:C4-type Zn-finger protein
MTKIRKYTKSEEQDLKMKMITSQNEIIYLVEIICKKCGREFEISSTLKNIPFNKKWVLCKECKMGSL